LSANPDVVEGPTPCLTEERIVSLSAPDVDHGIRREVQRYSSELESYAVFRVLQREIVFRKPSVLLEQIRMESEPTSASVIEIGRIPEVLELPHLNGVARGQNRRFVQKLELVPTRDEAMFLQRVSDCGEPPVRNYVVRIAKDN
jgi:hypothetical protein